MPPKVQNDPGDRLLLEDREIQSTGDYTIWTKEGKRINWYGAVYINDVLITDIEGIVGPEGPIGPPGAGGPFVYLHTQGSAATVWTINHNLGVRPSVEVRNAGSQVIVANVTHPTVNQAVVTLNEALTGTARLV